MSHLEKSLWTAFTLAAGFLGISLVVPDCHPHRFFFGVPFTLALFLAMASVSMLKGGALMTAIAAMIPGLTARKLWCLLAVLMAVRSLVVGLLSRGGWGPGELLISVVWCATTAFFLLIDCYQSSASWPKFDVPELGRVSVRSPTPSRAFSGSFEWIWFRRLSCILAAIAYVVLFRGLGICLGGRSVFDIFFISELGTGFHAETFTNTLMYFGLLLLPFFLAFTFEYGGQVPYECLRMSVGGTMAVCGIIGIGVWDMYNPLHYVSILIWLWPLAVILDQKIPTPRGFVTIGLPTWIVKGSMAGYIASMIIMGTSEAGTVMCIIWQRMVVATTLLWLLWVIKVMSAECVGLGESINGATT